MTSAAARYPQRASWVSHDGLGVSVRVQQGMVASAGRYALLAGLVSAKATQRDTHAGSPRLCCIMRLGSPNQPQVECLRPRPDAPAMQTERPVGILFGTAFCTSSVSCCGLRGG
jgi:hypothetical protein